MKYYISIRPKTSEKKEKKKVQRDEMRERENEEIRIELKITRVEMARETRDVGFVSVPFFEEFESDLEMATTVFFQLLSLIIFDFAKGKTTLFGICILLRRWYRDIYVFMLKCNNYICE